MMLLQRIATLCSLYCSLTASVNEQALEVTAVRLQSRLTTKRVRRALNGIGSSGPASPIRRDADANDADDADDAIFRDLEGADEAPPRRQNVSPSEELQATSRSRAGSAMGVDAAMDVDVVTHDVDMAANAASGIPLSGQLPVGDGVPQPHVLQAAM